MKKRCLQLIVLLVFFGFSASGVNAATISEITEYTTKYMNMIQEDLQRLQSCNLEEFEGICEKANGNFAYTVWLMQERNFQLQMLDFHAICALAMPDCVLMLFYQEINFYNFDLLRELLKKMTVAGPAVAEFTRNMARSYLATCGMIRMVWDALVKEFPEETANLALCDFGCEQRFRSVKKYLRKIIAASDEQLVHCIRESEEVIPRIVPETTDRLCEHFLQNMAFLRAYESLLHAIILSSCTSASAIDALRAYYKLLTAFHEGHQEAGLCTQMSGFFSSHFLKDSEEDGAGYRYLAESGHCEAFCEQPQEDAVLPVPPKEPGGGVVVPGRTCWDHSYYESPFGYSIRL